MSSRYGLKIGQVVQVEVVEVQLAGDLLVTFSGHLVLVSNTTDRIWQPAEKLRLVVSRIHPLEFQIFERRKDSLDRII
jgi:hypothetical protein